jgi:hypothetical protein
VEKIQNGKNVKKGWKQVSERMRGTRKTNRKGERKEYVEEKYRKWKIRMR